MSRLDGQVAVVTGGGSGIGAAACRLFSAAGAAVAVIDLDRDAAERTAEAVVAGGGRAVGLGADVADAAEISAAVAAAVDALGGLDVLYNNAGVAMRGSVLDTAEEIWDRCFAVNVKGTAFASRAAVAHLSANGGGSIVNTASVAGLVGVRDLAAYSAAKGAVIALTRSMAVDLAPLGIRVNAICPGSVHTPMINDMIRKRGAGDHAAGMAVTVAKYPMGRLGQPDEIARVAVFLAGDGASFLTGSVVTADGGMTAQ